MLSIGDFIAHYCLPPSQEHLYFLIQKLKDGEIPFNSPDARAIIQSRKEIGNIFRVHSFCLFLIISGLLSIVEIFFSIGTTSFDYHFHRPFLSLLLYFLIRKSILPFDFIVLAIFSFSFYMNIDVIFNAPNTYGLPNFFRIFASPIGLFPLASMYSLRSTAFVPFFIITMSVMAYSFYTSIDQQGMMTFTMESHHPFLATSITSQIYPILFFGLFQSELSLYQSLLLKNLSLSEDSSQQKTTFLSRMSHELRTPLHGLLSAINLLKQAKLSEEQAEYLSVIDTCGNMINDLVLKILLIVRVESGQFEVQKTQFNLLQVIQDVTDSFSTIVEEKGLDFIIDFQPNFQNGFEVEGDQSRFREVLTHIVSNSIKFTEKGGVTLTISSPEKNHYKFEIQDTGVGMTPEFTSVVFDPFNQANLNFKKTDGSGLGLAIAKKLTEVLHGSIGVKSQLGKGSSFWFEIPFTQIPPYEPFTLPQTLIKNPSDPSTTYKFGIFSSKSSKNLMKTFFKHWNLSCDIVETIEGCLEYDLVFIDQNLEVLSKYANLCIQKKKETSIPSGCLIAYIAFPKQISQASEILESLNFTNKTISIIKPLNPLKLLKSFNSIFGAKKASFSLPNYSELELKSIGKDSSHDLENQELEVTRTGIESVPLIMNTNEQVILNSSISERIRKKEQEKKQKNGKRRLSLKTQGNSTSTSTSSISSTSSTTTSSTSTITTTDHTIDILVVEDNPINQMIMKKQLQKLGVKFMITPSGEEAVKIWKDYNGDIPMIFMDIEIDGPINGLETTAAIRVLEKNELYKHLKPTYVVIMTGRFLESDITGVVEYGYNEYLTKPVSLIKVGQLIQSKILSKR